MRTAEDSISKLGTTCFFFPLIIFDVSIPHSMRLPVHRSCGPFLKVFFWYPKSTTKNMVLFKPFKCPLNLKKHFQKRPAMCIKTYEICLKSFEILIQYKLYPKTCQQIPTCPAFLGPGPMGRFGASVYSVMIVRPKCCSFIGCPARNL